MTALTLYGIETASSLATACKLVTSTGGVSASLTTKIGTVQGSGELFSLGSSATFPGTAVSASAGVHGFLWDVSTLTGNTIAAGTWTVKFNLNWNATYTTMSSTITARVWNRSSSGVYTKIGSDMTVAGPGASTTTQTLFTLTGTSFPAMDFATGDQLYLDVWLTVTSTGGATTRTIALWASSSTTLGIAGQVEIDTPGYAATPTPVALSVTIAGAGVFTPAVPTFKTALTTSIAGVGKIAFATYKRAVLNNSPIRYYRMDEASGTTAVDIGSQAQNGTISGGVTPSQAGLIADTGTSILFDGSSGAISLPTTSLPTGVTTWSMEAWIRFPSTLPTASAFPVVCGFGTRSTLQCIEFYFDDSTDAGANNLFLYAGASADQISSLSTISAQITYHVVATYNGTTLTFYLNGVAQGTLTVAVNIVSGSAYIGRDISSAQFWPGLLDEVAIYNTSLTAPQVATTYVAGVTALSMSVALSTSMAGVGTLTPTITTTGGVSLSVTIAGTGTLAPTLHANVIAVTVDSTTPTTLTAFVPGISHVDTSLNYPWGSNDATAIANVKALITAAIPYQNTFIQAWGTEDAWANPLDSEPSNWGLTDNRMQLAVDTSGTPVLSLCEAPWWMKGQLQSDGTTQLIPDVNGEWGAYTYSSGLTDYRGIVYGAGYVSPDPYSCRVLDNQFTNWLHLVQRVAERYMVAPYNVRYFQVWNELKGYYNPSTNTYDYTTGTGDSSGYNAKHGYTYFYNQTYAQLRTTATALGIDPNSIQIGGPYVTIDIWGDSGAGGHPSSEISASYGTYDQRSLDVVKYWLTNKTGAGFLTIDSSSGNRDSINPTDAFTASQRFADIVTWLRSLNNTTYPGAATLPFWLAEWYASSPGAATSDALSAAIKAYAMSRFTKSGGSVALSWGGTGEGTSDSGLWSMTTIGGGQPTAWYTAYKSFHTSFPPGTQLYAFTNSDTANLEVLPGSSVMLVNKQTVPQSVTLNGTLITALSPYEVRVVSVFAPLSVILAGVGTFTPAAPTFKTALTSTITGVGTLAPTLSAKLTLASVTLPGVGTLSGTASVTTALSQTLSGSGILTPTISLATRLSQTLSGSGILTPTISLATSLSASIAGTSTLSGTAQLSTALTSTPSGLGTLTLSAWTLSTALSQTLSGSGILTPTISLATSLSKTISGSGTLTGTLSTGATVSLSASIAGTSTLSGTASVTTALSQTLSGSGILTPTISLATSLSASIAGTSTLSGTAQLSTALTSTPSGLGTLTLSAWTLSTALTSTIVGAGTFTAAAPTFKTALSATIAGQGTLTPGIISKLTLPSTTIVGAGTLAGTLAAGAPLVVSLSGASTLSGTWTVRTALFVTCAAFGTLSGEVSLFDSLARPGIATVLDVLYGQVDIRDVSLGQVTLTDQG